MGASPDSESGRIERRTITAVRKELAGWAPRRDTYGYITGPRHAPPVMTEAARRAAFEVFESRRWEYGHGGYSGTMAEKHDVNVVELPKNLTPKQWVTVVDLVRGGLEGEYNWKTETMSFLKPTPKQATVMKKLGWTSGYVRQLHGVYDDKWGSALMLITPDRRWWLGGWCSS